MSRTANIHYLKLRAPAVVITPAFEISKFIYSVFGVLIEGVEKSTFVVNWVTLKNKNWP